MKLDGYRKQTSVERSTPSVQEINYNSPTMFPPLSTVRYGKSTVAARPQRDATTAAASCPFYAIGRSCTQNQTLPPAKSDANIIPELTQGRKVLPMRLRSGDASDFESNRVGVGVPAKTQGCSQRLQSQWAKRIGRGRPA